MIGLEINCENEMVRAGIPADCNLYAIISYIQRDGCIATLGRSNLKNQTRESWWDMKKLALGDKISIHVTDEIGEESLPMKIEPAKTPQRKWSQLDSFYALQQELRNEGIDVDKL